MICYHWALMFVRMPNNPGITMRSNTNWTVRFLYRTLKSRGFTLFRRIYFTTEKLSDVQWNVWGLGEIRTKMIPPHDKINNIACTPSEDSVQPDQPFSLIRVFAVRINKCLRSFTQRRRWSVWADAQADLRLPWAHRSFCWFCYAMVQCIWHKV